ncbi:MAG: penicillin-binding protein 2 [Acutalibacter sp.]|nr:penicillin-binding protein 2 [Acutalibacter sp.]
MKRKAYGVFGALVLLFGVACASIARISGGAEYVAAAEGQSIYRLDVAQARGVIYDCNLRPLVSEKRKWMAAVAPTIEAIGTLEKATGGEYRDRLALALEDGKPFLMELDSSLESPFIDLFNVPVRYEEDQLAPHVIGYLDSFGSGVSGIELAMNDVLENYSGQAVVYYQVDALGRVVAGGDRQVSDTLRESRGGVALTLDEEIQALTEQAAAPLGKGAVVVTEVPNCEIRALVSLPDYSPTDLGTAAESTEGALLNRAFCAYAPGSVFKLVGAAAGLTSGGNLLEDYECTGKVNVGGMLFHCFDGIAHGKVGLKAALEKSCNCYFINLGRSLGGQSILSMAYDLGLGEEQEFGRGLFTQTGDLPQAAALTNSRALANFSFGQGGLTVTPVQLCGMVNAIASGGVYSTPKLIAGTVDNELRLTETSPVSDRTVQVMSKSTAKTLRDAMEGAVKEGTAKPGAPTNCVAGVKTGTAQTGIQERGEELLHFWYCGYICDETGPRYCITVLRESVPEDYGVTARVFREIAQRLGERSEQ